MQKPIHRAGYRRFKIGAKTNFGRDYEYKSKNDSEKTESLAGMEDWQLGSSLSLRYTAWQSLSVDMKECSGELRPRCLDFQVEFSIRR